MEDKAEIKATAETTKIIQISIGDQSSGGAPSLRLKHSHTIHKRSRDDDCLYNVAIFLQEIFQGNHGLISYSVLSAGCFTIRNCEMCVLSGSNGRQFVRIV